MDSFNQHSHGCARMLLVRAEQLARDTDACVDVRHILMGLLTMPSLESVWQRLPLDHRELLRRVQRAPWKPVPVSEFSIRVGGIPVNRSTYGLLRQAQAEAKHEHVPQIEARHILIALWRHQETIQRFKLIEGESEIDLQLIRATIGTSELVTV